LCFLIQSQAGVNNDNTINTHRDVKRQSGNDCQCKDGEPGPTGEKGDRGQRGRTGSAGPIGLLTGMGNVNNEYIKLTTFQ